MNNLQRTILTSVAIFLTIGYIWYGNRTITPKKAVWDDVRAEAVKGGYRLVSTEKLGQQYEANPENLLLVDTRQEWEYRTGHIKGAINFPMEPTWLSRWRKKRDLEKALGPDKDHLIIFYGAGLAGVRSDSAAREFVMIKVDLTRRGSPDTERLLREFDVKGQGIDLVLKRSVNVVHEHFNSNRDAP